MQGLAIQQEIGDRFGEGGTLSNIAATVYTQGDHDTAVALLNRSLTIRQELGDQQGLCTALFNIGYILHQSGKQPQALQAWLRCYQIASAIQEAQTLHALDALANQLGHTNGLTYWQTLAQQT